MLSDQDKREMLADARSQTRRDSFRRIKALQEQYRPSLEEYCRFCEEAAALFPARPQVRQAIKGGTFLL